MQRRVLIIPKQSTVWCYFAGGRVVDKVHDERLVPTMEQIGFDQCNYCNYLRAGKALRASSDV